MVQAHLERCHGDYKRLGIEWMLRIFENGEYVLLVETSQGVHVNHLVLQEQIRLVQMMRDLLLQRDSYMVPLDIALPHDGLFAEFLLIETDIILEDEQILMLEELIHFVVSLAVIPFCLVASCQEDLDNAARRGFFITSHSELAGVWTEPMLMTALFHVHRSFLGREEQ